MRQAKLAHQPLERPRLLQRIEILTLDVLDERHGDGRLIGDVTDDGRNVTEPGHLRGAPAPLAGDDLVALGLAVDGGLERAHDYRLHHALRLAAAGRAGAS